ncbi:hypothetical protein JTE90_020873 [Oedothorax gibbosus]|uniref:IQ motif and ubiquitin-like domain-containing protein n=1 Tax=Oedothorax gibbosus TaxID=931172 RepID=A0AAV6UQR1_9ARAC|nr:hypothetical protein JTE90_020873 [Oedothorax gibbosus]
MSSGTEIVNKEAHLHPSNQTYKNYLGGYKHKLSGKIYHHAMVQTELRPWKYSFSLGLSCDAQTSTMQDKSQQTAKDASTQVKSPNMFLKATDQILEPNKNYKCYDDCQKEQIKQIVILQKYVRRWLAQKELTKKKKIALLKTSWDTTKTSFKSQEDVDWIKSLEHRKLNPKSDEDFCLLFSDLQNWWKFQENCISDARSGADLKAAMWLLLNSEIKKIEEIYHKKNEVVKQKNSDGRQMLLEMASKPKIWKANGKMIQVETKNTQIASCLHDLYTTLSMKRIPAQERVDALTNLKEFLKPYKCKLTDNLKELVDREIDLHLRGIKKVRLEGLQSRIRDLLWQLSKKPTVNPAMQKLSTLENSTSDCSKPYILCCSACKRFYILSRNSTDEATRKSTLENHAIKCNRCVKIENESWLRKDLELYKRILKLLITEEEKKPTCCSIIYTLRPRDIGVLVENIWKHQSCISGSREDIDLEFIRYDVDENWTPWNCLLVTREEAMNLTDVPNLEMKYDEKFKKCAFRNHSEARRYFSTIPRFLPYLIININE